MSSLLSQKKKRKPIKTLFVFYKLTITIQLSDIKMSSMYFVLVINLATLTRVQCYFLIVVLASGSILGDKQRCTI